MHNSILKKIWRDLSERKGRTLLTLSGLAIGLWGVGSVAVAWLVLQKDLSENFTSTNPPAIVMTVENDKASGKLDVESLKSVEGIAVIENRPLIMGRVEITPNRWMPLAMWVVDDFNNMQVATVFPESGDLPPVTGSIAFERDGPLLVNFIKKRTTSGATGHDAPPAHAPQEKKAFTRFEDEPINMRLAGGEPFNALVGGTVFDPRQAPSRMEQLLYGYVTQETAQLWTGGDFADRVLVTATAGYQDDTALRELAANLAARLERQGRRVTDIDYPSVTEHVHQFQMNSILWVLTGLGTLALLMSVVLVLNLINSILTGQVRQIGMLKAIGASTRQVSMMFLGAMLLLGLLSSLAALPFALKSGYIVSRFLAMLLNFKILTLSLPVGYWVVFVILGSIFPVLAAAFAVKRWCTVPVNNALQYFGVNPALEQGLRVDRMPMPLSMTMRMGLRNAFRKPKRALLTAATLALGVLIFMMAMNTRSSLLYTAETEEQQKHYDVVVTFQEPIDAARISWMDRFPIVSRAETWRAERASIIDPQYLEPDVVPFLVVPDDSDIIRPTRIDGEWLNTDQPLGIVIAQRLKFAHPQLAVGADARIRIGDREIVLPIVGVFKEFGPASIYIQEAGYQALFPDADARVKIAFVTLKESTEENLDQLTASLESHFAMANVPVRNLASAKIASRVIRGHLDVIVAVLMIAALMMLFVSSLGMASGISTSVVERTRELGILRAIGAKPGAIYSMLGSEAIMMALTGWLVALLIAQPLSRYLSEYFGTALVQYPFDYQGSLKGVVLSLALAMLLAGFATIAPARLVTRQSVKDAVGYE